jgi:hypothetical protein
MTTPESTIDYRHAVNSLRGSLRRSHWDASVAKRPAAKIHYIFDTNVFLFHANLQDTSTQMEDLASLLGLKVDDMFLRAMERLNSDRMFTPGLMGQGDDPVYISSPHFEEVIANTYKIEKTLTDGLPPATYGVRNRIRELLSRSDLPRYERLSELQRLIPTAWLESLRTRFHFNNVLESSFLGEKPRVMPLHHTPWGWEAGRPAKVDVDFWQKAFGAEVAGRDRNQANDALTLATIVDLYRNDRLSRYDNRRNLYLFVTSSPSISSAVTRELSSLKSEGIPYFVRSPRDFLPLVNLENFGGLPEMHRIKNQTEIAKFTEKLRAALDWNEFGPDERLLQKPGTAPRGVSDLQNAWRDLSGLSALLNATYFERYDDELFRGLSDFVHESYDDGLSSLTSKISQVRTVHVSTVLDSALAAVRYSVANQPSVSARRVQLKMIGRNIFKHLIDDTREVIDFIDSVIQKGTLDKEVEQRIGHDPGDPAAAILVACLFLAAEQWPAAADFASQAVARLDSRPPSVLACEANYLRALCLRFSSVSDGDFVKAARHLEQNIAYYRTSAHPENQWRRLRDQIERSSLFIGASVMQAISGNEMRQHGRDGSHPAHIPAGRERDYFGSGIIEAERSLDELLSTFEAELEGRGRRYHTLAKGLQVQALTNLAGAWVFRSALPNFKAVPSISRRQVLIELDAMIEEAARDSHALRGTQYIFASILAALETTNTVEQKQFVDVAMQRIHKLKADQPGMAMNDSTRFEFLAAWLSQWSQASRL